MVRLFLIVFLVSVAALAAAAEPRQLPRNEGCERLIVLDFKVSKNKALNRIHRSLPTVTALQGLINRSQSTYIYIEHPPIRIYDTVEDFGDASGFFLDAGLLPWPFERAPLDSSEDYPVLAWLLDHYGHKLTGFVRAPGDINDDAGARAAALNEVTFNSGINDDWLCYATDEVFEWMVARGYDLPVVADTRGMDQYEAFDWSWDRHIDHAKRSRDLIGYGETGATPPVANDWFVACHVWVHGLASVSKKDPEPEVDNRLDQLLDPNIYPPLTPHVGPVEGGKIIQRIQERNSIAFVSQPPNTSVSSSVPYTAMEPMRLEPRLRAPREDNGIYIGFNGPDGDTVDFLPWIALINIIEDPAFGEVPLNVRMTPFFVDTFPSLVGWASRLGNGIELQVSYNDGGPPPPGNSEGRAIYGASIKRLIDLTGGAFRHMGTFGNFPGSGRNNFDLVGSDDFLSIVVGYEQQGDGRMYWEEYEGIPHMAMLGQSRYPGLEEDEYEEETANRIAAWVDAEAQAGEPIFIMVRAPEPRGFRTLSRCKEVLEHLQADGRIGGRPIHAVPGSELAALWQIWNDGQWASAPPPDPEPTPSPQPARSAADFVQSVGVNGGLENDDVAAVIEDLGIRWVRTSLRDQGERDRLNDLHNRLGVQACALINPFDTLPSLGDADWLEIAGQRLELEDGSNVFGNYTVAGTYLTDTAKGSVVSLGAINFGGANSAHIRLRVADAEDFGFIQVWIDHYRRAQDGIVAGSTGSITSSGGAWQTYPIDFDDPVHGTHEVFLMFHPRKGLDTGAIGPWLDGLAADCGPAIGALEGPNEFDNTNVPDWADKLRAFQKVFYEAVKNHPSSHINSKPVIAPSVLGDAGHEELGDLRDRCDIGNMHPYTGGLHPEHRHQQKMEVNFPMVGAAPIWVTEFGWHTAEGYRPEQAWFWNPIPEALTDGYIPRGYLTHFMRRYDNLPWVEKSFIYRLNNLNDPTGDTDISAHYGIVLEDLSPKPGAVALKHLLDLCGEQQPASPGGLSYALDGMPEDGEHLALQRADGSWVLLLWRAHEDFNKRDYLEGASLADATQVAAAQQVRVHLADPVTAWASHRPHLAASAQRQGTATDAIDIAVDGRVTVLELLTTSDSEPPARPGNLRVRILP